jgi:hypothetical protein
MIVGFPHPMNGITHVDRHILGSERKIDQVDLDRRQENAVFQGFDLEASAD